MTPSSSRDVGCPKAAPNCRALHVCEARTSSRQFRCPGARVRENPEESFLVRSSYPRRRSSPGSAQTRRLELPARARLAADSGTSFGARARGAIRRVGAFARPLWVRRGLSRRCLLPCCEVRPAMPLGGSPDTLLRHVAELRPLFRPDGSALPAHGTTVELDQPEHRPHRRGLPGPVWSRKPVSRPGRAVKEQASSAGRLPNCLLAASSSSMATSWLIVIAVGRPRGGCM